MGWKDVLKKGARMMVMGEVDTLRDVSAQKKLAESGTPTTARVISFTEQWRDEEVDAGRPRWGASKMTLEVRPPGGGAPYEWSGDMWVRVKVAERGGPLEGRELPVRVDPSDPEKVAVDWEAVDSQG
ncbi:MAG TPA: hypothetical protein VHF58_01495 [Solirubrobacterales bacterium]|nr:hypothetical protein [Solirubrobacterales bacterium]